MSEKALTPRVILDTNVWSRVAEADAGAALRSAAHQAKVRVVAAPSVLYELVRIPVLESRRRALRLVTETYWDRLMPEAYLEAEELIAAIGRHHPEWLVKAPQLHEHGRLAYDWSRRNRPSKRRLRSPNKAGVWERARHGAAMVREHLDRLEGGTLDRARDEAKAARREIIDQNAAGPGPLDGVMAMYEGAKPGWRGDSFAHWRGEALESLSYYLFSAPEGAYLDWIAPKIDLRLVQARPAAWTRFWLYEVEEVEVARQWVRWAFRYLARFRKITSGTPCDIQLSAYLPDADYIASADRNMIGFVEEARRYSPIPLAKGLSIAGSHDAIASLFDSLRAAGSRCGE
jgi:hypothetical protein